MPDQSTLAIALVGAGGAVAGAIVAGLANAYAAAQRVKEIEIGYLQRLKDSYLENARKVTAEVYIPISVALTSLSNSYDRLSSQINFETKTSPGHFYEDFSTECLRYLITIDDLLKRGADVYLITTLDEALQSFTNFVRDSMEAKETNRKRVMKALIATRELRYLGVPSFEYKGKIVEQATSGLRLPTFNVRMLGFDVGYSERTYAAPIGSRDFEARMRTDIPMLKELIKEVTLGSHAAT
jgi:hypothetical protein